VFHPTLSLHLLFGRYDAVIVEPSTNFFNNLFTFPICKLFGKKFIWYEAGISPEQSIFRRIIDPIVNVMIRNADAYITCNSFADESLKELGAKGKKIFRAQNTIDTAPIMNVTRELQSQITKLRHDLKLTEVKSVLFIGALEKRKRVENLIRASRIVRQNGIEIKTIIVGNGPHLSEIKSFLEPGEEKNVIIAGRRVEDAPVFIHAADVVVLPGQGGLSIIDAFAGGKPCIATAEAGAGGSSVYDYIRDGRNGYVVQINDVQEIAEKLINLFDDEDLYSRLAKGAKETGRGLSVENMVDGMNQAILHAVN